MYLEKKHARKGLNTFYQNAVFFFILNKRELEVAKMCKGTKMLTPSAVLIEIIGTDIP